ncbi:MAG: hypothetical protein ACLFMX_06830 [Halobacteriales archaeon]
MRFKAVPRPPGTVADLEVAWRAVGLVPEGERSCCQRIADRLDAVDVDEARRWLALMRALGIVERGPSGYTRTRSLPAPATLRERFRDRVFGVEEVLQAADGRVTEASAFEALEPHVPPWERHRAPNAWRDRWRRRTGDLLAWGALLGLVERDGDTFRVPPNVIGESNA